MSALSEIRRRRARLVAKAEAQRRALGAGIAGCRRLLSVADRAVALARWLRAKPYLAVAAAVAVAAVRPRIALGWSARLLTLWRVGRFVFDVIRPAAAHRTLETDRSGSRP
jgi:YqjK-like protein